VSHANPSLVTGCPGQSDYSADDSLNHACTDASRRQDNEQEAKMGFGRGALLWLLGVPLPIVILLALFLHH
jgi:hypothetical protein